jgi:two-component system cell cycle response regulator DivK
VKNTVLVIEDNEQNLYLVRFLLEKHGLVVHEARDGRLGVLLDIQLPMLDGYAVAAEIRMDPALRDTPIIAVTSYAMVGDREKALASGATDYIEKPINPSTFIDQISKHLPR